VEFRMLIAIVESNKFDRLVLKGES
jgi:hypothetical protein